MANAFERMGTGWRDAVLPRLAGIVAQTEFRASSQWLSSSHGRH
jgi:hypothetical protein